MIRHLLPLVLLVSLVAAQDPGGDPEPEAAPEPVDVGAVLADSKEFKAKCEEFRVRFDREAGTVRAEGVIGYRGGGPCEYLINVSPAKSHETIVLLDRGPEDEKQRKRDRLEGLATTLNNALMAAGFRRGKHFDWNQETGETYPPKGETVHDYAEFKDPETGKEIRARVSDWLWNFLTVDVMAPGTFVYTGSMMIDEGPPNHKMWFGAEADRLLVGILNTSTVLIDNTEEGSLENGACGDRALQAASRRSRARATAPRESRPRPRRSPGRPIFICSFGGCSTLSTSFSVCIK
jgi:hypothetical protein